MKKPSITFLPMVLLLTLSFVSLKMWKQGKTLPALAVAMLLLFGLPGAATAQNNFNGFGWTQVGNTISITTYTGAGGVVVVPDTINGLPVTTIGDSAFFQGVNLTSITIPASVTTIGDGAFLQCGNLTNITLGAGVTSIGTFAFLQCSSLTNITIPASVTTIGGQAFSRCSSLTNMAIPAGVTNIGPLSFLFCTSLAAINVDAQNAFYSSVNGVLFDKSQSTLLEYPVNKAGAAYTIPASVTNIEFYAFEECFNLTTVTIPYGVASIEGNTFSDCPNLVSITIPASVTDIGSEAFLDCYSLSSIVIPSSVTNIEGAAFEFCSSLTNVTLGTGLTSIGFSAFEGCSSLTKVTIPTGVTIIGGQAFHSCSSLTNIMIPASVTNIGSLSFQFCNSLAAVNVDAQNAFYSSVNGVLFDKGQSTLIQYPADKIGAAYTIPASVTNIEAFAFYGSRGLTTVTIPAGVTTIGDEAFDFCFSLSNITIPASITHIGSRSFEDCISLAAINVDAQNAFYSSVNGVLFDKSQSTLIQYPGGKTGAAYTIPAGVTTIQAAAFYGCIGLTTVTIPASVTTIGDEAFGLSGLNNVCFEGSPPNYGQEVFLLDAVAVISYISGTPGWGTTYGSIPTAPCAECGGSLQVTITPANAVSAGAEWQVDGGAWEPSGTVTNLPAGSHTVGFLNIAGWNTPPNQIVNLTNGLLATVAGNCTLIVGALQVNLGPAGAVSAGAQWRVDGGAFLDSGAVVTNLSAGSHTISFKNISGWVVPSAQSATVSGSVTNVFSGTYLANAGAVQVNLNPAAAVIAGAQWAVDGGSFLASGSVVTNLPAGSHTISFKSISGWSAPSAQSISVSFGVTNMVSGTYLPDPGAIQVNLSPPGAVSAGAQWQVDGGTFQNSGAILGNVSPGSHTLSFKTISGWLTPANQNLNINSDLTNISSGVYGLLPGVTTLPPGNFNGSTVTLNGNISPNGLPTTVYYNYGPDSMCTNFVSAGVLLSNNLNTSQAVPIVVTGLLPGPTYRVQAVVSNSAGTILGSVVTFSWPGPLDTNPNDVRTVTWNRAALGQTISGFCCASSPQAVNYTWPNNNNWSQAFQFGPDSCGDLVVTQPSNWGTNNPPNGTNYNVIVGSQGGAPVNLDIGVTVNSFVLQSGGGLNIVQQQLAANLFDFQGDFDITSPGNGFPRLAILSGGKMMKSSGTNSLTFDPAINLSANNATLEADSGTLILPGRSSTYSNCLFNAAPGAILQFMPTNQGVQATLAGVSSGAGGGLVLFNSGQLSADISGGTLNFPGPLFVWTGGSISVANATVTNTGVINIRGTNAPQVIGAGIFLNRGAMENLDTNAVFVNGATTFINDTNAFYDLTADGSISGTGIFFNYGTLRKSGGTNTSTIGLLLDNLGGTIDVESGNLVLAGSGTSSNGTVHVSANATLDLTGGRNVSWSGILNGTGAGQVLLSSGRFQAAASGVSLNLAGTLFLWTGGLIDLGNGSVTNSGVINLKGSNAPQVLGAGGFYNSGLMANLDINSLAIASFGGSIENLSGGTYDFATDGGIGGFGHFYNDGLVRKSGGTNISVISPTFVNQGGSIEVDMGTLSLSGPFDQGGGAMIFRLNGLAQGQSGQLLDNSSVALGGTLRVSFADTFAPPIGTQFQLVSGSSCTGSFSAVNVPVGTMVTYSSTGVFLVVTGAVPVHILSPQIVGTNFLFKIPTISGQSYTVQKSDELVPANWTFYSNFTGNGGLYQFVTPATNVAERFFRIQEP